MAIHRCMAHPYGEPVFFTDSTKSFARMSGTPENDRVLGRTTEHKDGGVIVGVFDGSRQTLVHELVHAVLFILSWKGMDPQDSSGEAMAYLLDYLYGEGCKLVK